MKAIRFFTIGLVAAFAFLATACNENPEENPEQGGGYDDSALKFSFLVTEVTDSYAAVTVTPSDSTAPYYSYFVEADEVSSNYSGDIEEYFKAVVTANSNLDLSTGEKTIVATELAQNTTYVVFAGAVRDGQVTSTVQSETFTTDELQLFTVTVTDLTAGSATITVTPADPATPYYFDVLSNEDLEMFGGAEAAMQMYFDYYLDYGFDWSDFLSLGEDGFTYSAAFVANTTYTVFAAYIQDGEFASEVYTVEFTTPEPVPSNNTFTITENAGYITVTPSNDDVYFWDLFQTASLEGLSDSEIVEAATADYIEMGFLAYFLCSGEDSYDYSGYLTDGEWTVVAFGYDGGATTAVTRYDFVFDSSNLPSDDDVTFNVDITVNGTSALVGVTPSENSVPYYFDAISADDLNYYYDGDATAYFEDILAYYQDFVDYGIVTWNDILSKGYDSYEFSDLEANTDYYVVTAAVRNGKITSPIFTDAFTTQDAAFYFYSTLTGDVDVKNIVAAYATAYGDYYGTGTNNWYVELYTNDGYLVITEAFTSLNETSPNGKYTIDWQDLSGAAGTAFPGFVDGGYLCGTWYADDEVSETYASAVEGTAEISGSGINILFYDGNSYQVKANYTGSVEVDTSYMYAAYATRSSAITRKTMHQFSSVPAMRIAATKKAESGKTISTRNIKLERKAAAQSANKTEHKPVFRNAEQQKFQKASVVFNSRNAR